MLREAADFSAESPEATITPSGGRTFASLIPEYRDLSAAQFRFQEPFDPCDTVQAVSMAMLNVPPEDVYVADNLLLEPDLRVSGIPMVFPSPPNFLFYTHPRDAASWHHFEKTQSFCVILALRRHCASSYRRQGRRRLDPARIHPRVQGPRLGGQIHHGALVRHSLRIRR